MDQYQLDITSALEISHCSIQQIYQPDSERQIFFQINQNWDVNAIYFNETKERYSLNRRNTHQERTVKLKMNLISKYSALHIEINIYDNISYVLESELNFL